MSSELKISGWREGRVDQTMEHFELCYVPAGCDSNEWIPLEPLSVNLGGDCERPIPDRG